MDTPPSVQIQTVLFEPAPGEVDRFVRGLISAVANAKFRQAVGRITVSIGDSSPHRSIGPAHEQALGPHLAACGIDAFRYRFFDANLGSAGGHNRLAEECDSTFVLVANPDTYLGPDLLCELVRPFDDPSVGAADARQLPLEHPKAYDPVTGDTSWASGACVMVRTGVWSHVGGYDAESFFLYGDDVDMSWRIRLGGWRVCHQPSARVFHDKRLGTDGRPLVSDAEVYYAAEAALLMAYKYSRPDLVGELVDGYSASDVAAHQRAAHRFLIRKKAGRLPDPIDPEGRVAEFVGFDYGPSRYSYSG